SAVSLADTRAPILGVVGTGPVPPRPRGRTRVAGRTGEDSRIRVVAGDTPVVTLSPLSGRPVVPTGHPATTPAGMPAFRDRVGQREVTGRRVSADSGVAPVSARVDQAYQRGAIGGRGRRRAGGRPLRRLVGRARGGPGSGYRGG